MYANISTPAFRPPSEFHLYLLLFSYLNFYFLFRILFATTLKVSVASLHLCFLITFHFKLRIRPQMLVNFHLIRKFELRLNISFIVAASGQHFERLTFVTRNYNGHLIVPSSIKLTNIHCKL